MSEIITIREAFEKEIRDQQEALEATRARLAALETYAPEVLDLVTGLAWDSRPVFGCWVSIEDHNYLCPNAATVLLGLSGDERLELDDDNRFSFFFGLGEGEDRESFHFTLRRRERPPCKKARVTQTKEIEVCGKLDESKYDEVVWLEQ